MKRKVSSMSRVSRILRTVFIAVLISATFMQISWLSEITSQTKQNDEMSKTLVKLNAEIDNLSVELNKYHDIDTIRAKAEAMNMCLPESSQIRVIAVAGVPGQNTSEQAALPGGTNAQ